MFVVIYAEDRLFRAQCSLASAGRHLVVAPADGPGWTRPLVSRSAPVWWFKTSPWPGPRRPSARDGASAPGEQDGREQSSPVCSTGEQCHLPGKRSRRTAGAREALGRRRLPRGLLERKRSVCCDAVGAEPEEAASPSAALQTAMVALRGARDCAAVERLSTQIVRKQAKDFSSQTMRRTLRANIVVNACQEYEEMAASATAKLERKENRY